MKPWQILSATAAIVAIGGYVVLRHLLDSPAASPDNDYWGMLARFLVDGEIELDLQRLLSRQNEHITFLPNLVYAANVVLTNGHNIYLQLFAFALTVGVAVGLVLLLPATIKESRWAFAGATLIIAILSFTPHAAHSWFLGFSGTITFLATCFFIASVLMFRSARDRGNAVPFALGTAAVVASYLSFSPGTSSMLLGFVFLMWFRAPRPWLLAFVAICALMLAATVGTFHRPVYHPAYSFDIPAAARFVGLYFGYFVSADINIGIAAGLAGVALYFVLVVVIVRRDPRGRGDLAPWLLVPAYALLAAIVTALSRTGFGLEMAMASRYAGTVSLFWAGLLITLLALAMTAGAGIGRRVSWAALALVGIPVLSGQQTDRLEKHVDRNHFKRLAEVGLALGIEDETLLRHLTPWVEQFTTKIEMLKEAGHAPFSGVPECAGWLGKEIPGENTTRVRGFVDAAESGSASAEYFRIHGWAAKGGLRADCVAIVDQEGTVVGAGIAGFRRPDVVEKTGIDQPRTGWIALLPDAGNGPLRAFARFGGADRWHQIDSCFRLSDGRLQGSVKDDSC